MYDASLTSSTISDDLREPATYALHCNNRGMAHRYKDTSPEERCEGEYTRKEGNNEQCSPGLVWIGYHKCYTSR